MAKTLSKIIFVLFCIINSGLQARESSGLLFNVEASGTPVPQGIEITLCLNAKGPLSCQKYTVHGLVLSIRTTIPNHTYPNAGIKINTPGYTLSGTPCTPISNGFCIFSANSVTPAIISLEVNALNAFGVSSGAYSDVTTNLFPMLIQAKQGRWTYSIDHSLATLPPDFQNLLNSGSLFLGITCKDTVCLGAGNYASTAYSSGNGVIVIGQSRNQGSWQYPINTTSTLPNDFEDGKFNGVSCGSSVCIAGGTYTTSLSTFPLLAQSNDLGNTWLYSIDASSSLPLDYGSSGVFNSVSCSNNLCIAGGHYNNIIGTAYPLLAQSTDGGLNWSYTISDANVPSDYLDSGTFQSVSCSGTTCIAGGSYRAVNSIQYLLLAQSTNGGASWSYVITSASIQPSGFQDNGTFNSVSCSQSVCLAGGSYTASTLVPVVARSDNGGASWIYTIDASSNLPPNFQSTNSGVTSLSCNNSTCTAGGDYQVNTILFPMLAQSLDAGSSWSYVISNSTNLPYNFLEGAIFSTSCDDTTCLAAGFYHNTQGILYPTLAVSVNSFIWSYIVEEGGVLPSGFQEGAFTTVNRR